MRRRADTNRAVRTIKGDLDEFKDVLRLRDAHRLIVTSTYEENAC
jgi:hypothetical protein